MTDDSLVGMSDEDPPETRWRVEQRRREGIIVGSLNTVLEWAGYDTIDPEFPLEQDPPPPPPPPPPPFTLAVSVDCSYVDTSLLYVYNGWDYKNGQGPRDESQLVSMIDDGGVPFLRFRSEPVTEEVEVWDRQRGKVATFPAGSYVSAGASLKRDIAYGAVEITCRATQVSDSTRVVGLLWPKGSPAWPAREVDYPEVSGDGELDQGRQQVGFNSHYKDSSGVHKQHNQTFAVNMLEWHTYRTEWTPESIKCFIDGELVGEPLTEDVPTGLMTPCIQTALQGADEDGLARPGTTPGGMDVSQWDVYDYTPAP